MPPKGSSPKPSGRPGGSRGPSGAAASSAPLFSYGYAPAFGSGGTTSSSGAIVPSVPAVDPRVLSLDPTLTGGFYLPPTQPAQPPIRTAYDPPAPPLFPPLAPAPPRPALMAPPPVPLSQIQRLRAMRDRLAPNAAPDGFVPVGQPGPNTALPNYLPAGRPMLSNPRHINPRADNQGRQYGIHQAGDPHSNAIPPLDVQITLMEIIIFFPAWFTIPDVAMRAKANEWGRKHLGKADVDARGQVITQASLKTSEDRFQKNTSEGGNLYFTNPINQRWTQEIANHIKPFNDLTANMWELRGSYTGNRRTDWGHILLLPVAQRVPLAKWPQGLDRGLLTKCLQFVLNDFNNTGIDRKWDTSHWHLIIHYNDWDIPGGGVRPLLNGAVVDIQARKRLHERVPDP